MSRRTSKSYDRAEHNNVRLSELRNILLGDPGMPDAIRPLRYLQSLIDSARGRGLEGSDDPEAVEDAINEVQELHDKLKGLIS